MNLEAIEQQVLSYLGQVTNPLVRVEVLLAHLNDRGLADNVNAASLKDFLARHELVRVIEPPIPGAEDSSGPYVILATRVPTQEQVNAMMLEQLDALRQALITARTEAVEAGKPMRTGALVEALRRVDSLRKMIEPPEREA